MSKQQPTLFTFFKKSQSDNDSLNISKNAKQINKNRFSNYELVWAKLAGYPWWPALVYEHPVQKVICKNKSVHVQFFEDPPTRGWVRDIFVKKYGAPEASGIADHKDPLWIKAKAEADQILALPIEERGAIIAPFVQSEDEDDNTEDSDMSKENVDVNNISVNKRSHSEEEGQPKIKKRRILIKSDSEDLSGDEYKPNKEELSGESSDGSVSSGVDENNISDIEQESASEIESPVKQTPKRKKINGNTKGGNNVSFTPKFSSPSASPQMLASTKSKLSAFAATSGTPSKPNEERQDWPYTKLEWLKPDQIRDKARRPKSHPNYDPRTLYVPDDFLPKQTPAMRQWWELKRDNFDTVLFFKMGKFYELFHMDATMSIQELGLLMMKGDQAHTGFPEIAFGRYASVLVEKGYKIARVEQVETPEMMEKRCKQLPRPSKFDKVVKRELCQVMSRGTRLPSFLDPDSPEDSANYLLSITEKGDTKGVVRIFGLAFVDVSIGVVHLGQFEDERHLSRLRTLLARFPPAQVLMERNQLSTDTVQLLRSYVPINLIDPLTPEKEFWESSKILNFLADSNYYKNNDGHLEWPDALEESLDEGDTHGRSCKEEFELSLRALGGLTWYLNRCQIEQDVLSRKMFEIYHPPDIKLEEEKSSQNFARLMVIDGLTLRNLEMFENSLDGSTEGTLFEKLNHCRTAFGKRLLRQWMCSPLCSKKVIDARLDAIEDLRSHPEVVSSVQPLLKSLPDLEKLLSKIHSLGLKKPSDHPDSRSILYEMTQYSQRKVSDFLSVLEGFENVIRIVKTFEDILPNLKSDLLKKCITYLADGGKLLPMEESLKYFGNAFDHGLAKKEGKIIPNKDVDSEYDESVTVLNSTNDEADSYLKDQCKYFGAKHHIEKNIYCLSEYGASHTHEIHITGRIILNVWRLMRSEVTYWGNDKKRFQLEVPDHATKRAGDDFELISQRKGFKRFWTDVTKRYLEETVSAEAKRDAALLDIARRIFEKFDQSHEIWKSAVDCMSVLDVLFSLTEFSFQSETVRPELELPSPDQKPFLEIRNGKHPCSLQIFGGGDFIPNDVVLGVEDKSAHESLVLVTGPNMGGKSTLMRQTALLCILAQMGCFVPAEACRLSMVDRIFSRLGASDRIYEGESTFFVELAETSAIVRHATRHSLVIVDELGRGTATYDGTSIAFSVVKELTQIGCRTLFSTHYHSLVEDFTTTNGLETGVSLGHMSCIVEEDEQSGPTEASVTFLYKFVPGACPKSYGFNAARLAALPESVIQRAAVKAKELEKTQNRKNWFLKFSSDQKCTTSNFKDILQQFQSIGNVL